jgi:hypothetical protein
MQQERPFRPLTPGFGLDSQGYAPFSWDLSNGPFVIGWRLNSSSIIPGPESLLPAVAPSFFQFTSALGYLDIIQFTIPREPRFWQPRGVAEHCLLVQDLEEVLQRHGGAWRHHRYNEQGCNPQTPFPELRAIATINFSIAQSVTLLAAQQTEYNHLEDDDLQHLE